MAIKMAGLALRNLELLEYFSPPGLNYMLRSGMPSIRSDVIAVEARRDDTSLDSESSQLPIDFHVVLLSILEIVTGLRRKLRLLTRARRHLKN